MGKRGTGQPKVRNWQAVAAHMRSGSGAMGGTPKQKNKRDRKAAKQDLRAQQ